jgi:hypothetical protein
MNEMMLISIWVAAVVLSVLVALLRSYTKAIASLLVFMLVLSVVPLSEHEYTSGLLKVAVGIALSLILFYAVRKIAQGISMQKFGLGSSMAGIVVSIIVAILIASKAGYILNIAKDGTIEISMGMEIFALSIAVIASFILATQNDLLKIAMGVVLLENAGSMLLHSMTFEIVVEVISIFIVAIFAWLAIKNKEEFGTVDAKKLTPLGGS